LGVFQIGGNWVFPIQNFLLQVFPKKKKNFFFPFINLGFFQKKIRGGGGKGVFGWLLFSITHFKKKKWGAFFEPLRGKKTKFGKGNFFFVLFLPKNWGGGFFGSKKKNQSEKTFFFFSPSFGVGKVNQKKNWGALL